MLRTLVCLTLFIHCWWKENWYILFWKTIWKYIFKLKMFLVFDTAILNRNLFFRCTGRRSKDMCLVIFLQHYSYYGHTGNNLKIYQQTIDWMTYCTGFYKMKSIWHNVNMGRHSRPIDIWNKRCKTAWIIWFFLSLKKRKTLQIHVWKNKYCGN